MPITVRHTPVGALGQAALAAGQARAAQMQASRDFQLTSMAASAQHQAAARQQAAGISERAREHAFSLQRAAATQMVRQRPATPATLDQRQKLQKTVSEAKAAGIYDPMQIKQMQIFADIGDESAVRSILGRLPEPSAKRPTARQKELTRQMGAFSDITQKTLAPIQQELASINSQISARYEGAEIQRFVESNPMHIPETERKRFQKMFARRRELGTQIEAVGQEAEQVQDQISLGFSIPEQAMQNMRRASKRRQADIDMIKRTEGRNQKRTERKIAVKQRELKRNPYADPDKEDPRIEKVKSEIEKLEEELSASYAREDAVLGGARQSTTREDTDLVAQLIAETGGDIEAAKRLYELRGGK